MSNQIKAVGFYQHLPINQSASFQDLNLPRPTIREHDLLVQVTGIAVNPVDTAVRSGGRATRLVHPKIIGWDAVGTVIDRGAAVTLFQPGDRVWYAGDFTRSGSDAQQQAVDERLVGRAPTNLTDAQAAAVPLVGLTAYESLFEQLQLNWTGNAGQTILIINGAGGVGSMAVQLAKLAGLTVIATASRPASIAWVRQLGADLIIDHHQELSAQVHRAGYHYVDYVLNLNNLDAHWQEIATLIKPDGRIVATTENHRLIDLQKLTKKRATFAWEWMYSKSYYQTATQISQHHILTHLAELYENASLQPINKLHYSPINAANLKRAHAAVEAGTMVGKVVLTGWEP